MFLPTYTNWFPQHTSIFQEQGNGKHAFIAFSFHWSYKCYLFWQIKYNYTHVHVWYQMPICTCIMSFFIYILVYVSAITFYLQGIKEGWYDGGSIAIAVLIVIIVTGTYRVSSFFKCISFCGLQSAFLAVLIVVPWS